MAIYFNSGSSQYAEVNSAVVATYPMTMVCRFNAVDVTNWHALMFIGDSTVTNQYFGLEASGGTAGDPLTATVRAGGSAINADTTNGYSANTWHHAAGVFASATERYSYLDGATANRGTSTTSTSPTTPNRTSIGRFGDSSPYYGNVRIAEACIWDVALTSAEIESLNAGASPFTVRPDNLVFFVPLVRDNYLDIINGLTLTAGGAPTVYDHPRIFEADESIFIAGAAAVGGAASIDSIGTITPGATGIAFTYSNFGSTPNSLTLSDGTNSFAMTSVSAAGGSGTFSCPAIASIGCMFSSATYTITATLSDGTDSDGITATFNPPSGYAVSTPTGTWSNADTASLAYNWGSNVTTADQVIYPTNDSWAVDAADGHWTTNQVSGTSTLYAIDHTTFSVETFYIVFSSVSKQAGASNLYIFNLWR